MLFKLFTPLGAIDARYHDAAVGFSTIVLAYIALLQAAVVVIAAILTERYNVLSALPPSVLALTILLYGRKDLSIPRPNDPACFLTLITSVTAYLTLTATAMMLHRVHISIATMGIIGMAYLLMLLLYNLRLTRDPATYHRQSPTQINDKVEP